MLYIDILKKVLSLDTFIEYYSLMLSFCDIIIQASIQVRLSYPPPWMLAF